MEESGERSRLRRQSSCAQDRDVRRGHHGGRAPVPGGTRDRLGAALQPELSLYDRHRPGRQPDRHRRFSPANATVIAGGPSGSTTVTATLLTGATQPVSLTASGLPVGTTATFSQPSCSPTCAVTLTLAAGATTPAGTSTITVTGNPLGRTT